LEICVEKKVQATTVAIVAGTNTSEISDFNDTAGLAGVGADG
jgi:hypothetical protein